MITKDSVVFSKNISAIALVDSALWRPIGKVGIISLCPYSGISLKQDLGKIGIDTEFLKERDIMNRFISDLADFDLVFLTENDNTSLMGSFRLSQTMRELSEAHIILVSTRQEAQGLSIAFGSVCDVVISFPIDKEKLSYVVRQLVNSNNPIHRRVLGTTIEAEADDVFSSGLLYNLIFWLVLGGATFLYMVF